MRFARSNPWPAFVDLFSALLIACLAGLMMFLGAYEGTAVEDKAIEEAKQAIDSLSESLKRDAVLSPSSRDCGRFGKCVDLQLHFDLNSSAGNSEREIAALREACNKIKAALDALGAVRAEDIEVDIEGHTDDVQPKGLDDPSRFRYNWELSARRATTVMHEFSRCGLSAGEYRIRAIGYADSEPLKCDKSPEACRDQNRRTTLKLRVNLEQIQERLSDSKGGSAASSVR